MRQPAGWRVQVALILVALVSVAIGLAYLPKATVAEDSDMNRITTKYPAIIGSRIDSCDLCHTSNIPDRNAYGRAYKSHGRNTAALAAIEALDSDGDGFSNLAEIRAFTFPGDKNDHPAQAPTATAPATATAQPTVRPSSMPTLTLVPTVGLPLPPRAWLPIVLK